MVFFQPMAYIWLKCMGVSKNRGTPKWMVKIMENPIIDDLGGKPTILGNTRIKIYVEHIKKHWGLVLKTPTTRWWQLKYAFYVHHYLGGRFPSLTSIFFRWVGSTTNQAMSPSCLIFFACPQDLAEALLEVSSDLKELHLTSLQLGA